MEVHKVLVVLYACLAFSRSQIGVSFFPNCVPLDSCAGLTSGLYPSCTSCTKFVICTNGAYSTFPCPTGRTYNPNTGMCDTSGSCNLASLSTANTPNPNPLVTHQDKTTTATTSASTTTATTAMTPKTIIKKGNGFVKTITFRTGCVRNCYGQMNGFYPSCYGCNRFVICQPYHRRIASCPFQYKWDGSSNSCQPSSPTCQEVVTYTTRRPYYYRPSFFRFGWK